MAGAAGVPVVLVIDAGVGLDVVIVVLPAVARAMFAVAAGCADLGLGAAVVGVTAAAGCAVVPVLHAALTSLVLWLELAVARLEAAVMGARVDFPGFRICDELAGDGGGVTVAGHRSAAVFAMWHSCPFGVVVGMVLCNAHRTNKQRESPLPREAGGGTRDRETTHQPISSVTSAFAAGLRFAAGLAAGFAAGFATRSLGKEA